MVAQDDQQSEQGTQERSEFSNYFRGLDCWKHRNACVFEGDSPSLNMTWSELKNEHSLWCMAGARKLQGLGLTLAV